MGRKGVGESRNQLQALDAFSPDEIGQRRRVEQDRTWASDKSAAGRQGADPVAGEDIEAESRGLKVPERRPAEIVGRLPGGGNGEESTVGDHHALGSASSARREDDIGEILGVHTDRRVPRIFLPERLPGVIERENRHRRCGEPISEMVLGQE